MLKFAAFIFAANLFTSGISNILEKKEEGKIILKKILFSRKHKQESEALM